MTARSNIATLVADLQEVLAWGEAAEAANAAICAERDAAVAQCVVLNERIENQILTLQDMDATIAAKDAEIAEQEDERIADQRIIANLTAEVTLAHQEIARLTALLNPVPAFTVYNEMKSTGHIPGWSDILVIYSNQLFPTDDFTAAPDPAFLRQQFAAIKADHPGVNRVVLDSEKWIDPTTKKITAAHVPYYVTLINVAKEFWGDVGIYAMVPERFSIYLNYPVGHDTYNERWDGLMSRMAICQPIWDAVDTIYPSFYPINPIWNNAALRDAWLDDYLRMCRHFAPGKPVIAFLMARVHPSVDRTMPYLSGAFWRSFMEKVKSAGYDGLVLYQNTTDPDPLSVTPRPDWYLETEAFRSTVQR